MDPWRLLNDVRKSVYCSKKSDYSAEMQKLVSLASNSVDAEFVRCVLLLREDIVGASAKVKLLWLTSVVGDNFYAPLDVELAGPVPWNGPCVLDTRSAGLRSRYVDRSPLAPEEIAEVRQCQDIDNCSFAASLIGLKVHNVKGPKIRQLSQTVYAVNLHFNGASNRIVTVDTSRIPTDAQGNQLSIHSGDLTDKIVELAHLQITAGSYDTHGSNCAIDTFRLTGYLPEITAASRIDIKKLIKYFQSGLCIIAVGTGTDASKLIAPLIKGHDYAVIAVSDERLTLTLQDPLNPMTRIEINQDDLKNHYEQVYLNWDHTKLFNHSSTVHFFYKAESCNRFNSITDKPLFTVRNRSRSKQSVRLLLETNLREEPISSQRVAYLRETPKDITGCTRGEPSGACNVGLQLLKLELDAGGGTRLFCHSSNSESFTIHVVSNSELVSCTRETKSDDYLSIEFDAPKQDLSYPCQYYKNPAIMVNFAATVGEHMSFDLQLLADSSKDMINAEVYHAGDYAMIRPLTENPKYEQQKYEQNCGQIITNTPYKVVCSSYSKPVSQKFKLIIKPTFWFASHYLGCKMKQVYHEYGEFPHHLGKRFGWPADSNRVKIRLSTKANNICFIRVAPLTQTSLPIRCNIFDEETHGLLHGGMPYQKPGLGGLVIDQLSINDCASIVLLIEKDEAFLGDNSLSAIDFELLIGSQTKMTLVE